MLQRHLQLFIDVHFLHEINNPQQMWHMNIHIKHSVEIRRNFSHPKNNPKNNNNCNTEALDVPQGSILGPVIYLYIAGFTHAFLVGLDLHCCE